MIFPNFTIAGFRFISPYVTENLSYVAKFPANEPVWLVSLAVSLRDGAWQWFIETWGRPVPHQWESGDEAFPTKEDAAVDGLKRFSGIVSSLHKEFNNDAT